jgi:hypothetical protein
MKQNKAKIATAEDSRQKRRKFLIILLLTLSVEVAAWWWLDRWHEGPEFAFNWPDGPFPLAVRRFFAPLAPFMEIFLALLSLFITALVFIRIRFGAAALYKTVLASAIGAAACAWSATAPLPPPTKATPKPAPVLIDEGNCYCFDGGGPPNVAPEPAPSPETGTQPVGAAGV